MLNYIKPISNKYYQLNQFIKAPSLRVIDEEGTQLGVLSTPDALSKARAANLDLVVVAEKADPPVAKIIDFQKFKYQQAKKERSGQVKSKTTQTKDIRFTPFMAKGDFDTRILRCKEFLQGGYRVKIVVKFVGRQLAKKDFGSKVMFDAIAALSQVGSVEQEPKWQGKLFVAQLKPKSSQITTDKQKEPNKNEDQN